MRYIDLTGKRFSRLTVVGRANNRVHGSQRKVFFKCLCDCGNYCDVITSSLKSGITRSCGCIKAEQNVKLGLLRKGKPSTSKRTGLKYVTGVYFKSLQVSAKNRNLEFSITIDYIEDLLVNQKFKCKLSGLDIVMGYGTNLNKTASLDRIDSNKGYTVSNVQWVHKDINFMKQNQSDGNFIKLCELVYLYNNKLVK